MKPVYVIAEAGVNHQGSRQKALALVDAAAKSGADGIKFQTFVVEKLASRYASRATYQTVTGEPDDQISLLRSLELSREDHLTIVEHCRYRKIDFLSSAFDLESLDFLTNVCRVDKIKIPSGEITHFPLLARAARTGLPVLLSTGMSTESEIREALARLTENKVTLLHCTSEYPTPYPNAQLHVMDELAATFDLPVGYSDHTLGMEVAWAAVARGACVIEKHITLDHQSTGPDHAISLEPAELKRFVSGIRHLEQAIGCGVRRFSKDEEDNRRLARRSLFARRPISSGERFCEENLICLRPDIGISATRYEEFLGEAARRDYAEGEPIQR